MSYVKQEHRCQILESPTSFIGSTAPFAPWGFNFIHTQLSSGHEPDTTYKDLGNHPKRLTYLVE